MRKLIYSLLFLFSGAEAYSQFSPGNLAILQADASASNTTCSVIEINTITASQSAITTVAISGTGASALRFSGSATSTGYMANSNDGTLLCFTGVNNTNTSSNVNTLNPRGVGTLNALQTFSLPTTYTGVSGMQTRCATTIDNSNWYLADQNGLYTNGTSTASPVGNFRSIKAFGGIVYVCSASSTSTVIQVDTLTAISGGTVVGLPGLTNNANIQDFYMISSGSHGSSYDILYVLSATSNTTGTISKFSFVSGLWTANGTYTTSFGGFGLAAQVAGGGANLYATTGQGALTGNSVIKLNDAAGYNSAIAITAANNVTLFTADAARIIKGIAFTPVAATAPAINPLPVSISFGSLAVASFSTGQTVTLTASNLTPSSGSLTVTAPNANFQVSDNGTTWNNTATVNYSGNGASIGTFQARFSPQASGLQSGNITITGGGLSAPATVAVNGTGTNNLSLTFSASTTAALNPPYISGTLNDVADPAQQQGIITDVKENGTGIPAINYTLTASSGNTLVVPNGNINITQADGQATIKITPVTNGYADITLTLTEGANNTTLVIHYAASISSSSSPGTHWHTNFADASGAIPLDDNYMIVCNDELNLLYVYNRNQSGLPVATYDFNHGNILGLTDGSTGNWKEVDVECGTSSPTVPGKLYWLGSMSNSSSFNNKPNRNRLFAVGVTGTGAATSFTDSGYYANLRSQLISWGDSHGYDFSASAQDGHDPKTIDGFNIEGMVFGPDNTTLYIGFRAPLVPIGSRTKAVIAPIQNFETWFNNGSPAGSPTIGAPIELDLGTRGIRDMIRLSNGNYIILAGSYDGTLNPAVFRWTGHTSDTPVFLSSFDVSQLNIEGVLPVNEAGQLSLTKLQFVSDDGDAVYYGDGIAAKDLSQDNFKKFNSDIITSSTGAVLPVQFEYFTATKQGNNSVILNWKMGEEGTIKYFDVFRSFNGTNYTLIGTLNAISGQTNYSFNDNNITAGNSKVYYRIKTTEITNEMYWSAIRAINFAGIEDRIRIYPNPVTDNSFSVIVNNAGDKKIEIYNSMGVLHKQVEFVEQAKDINTTGWPRGSYLLRIITADGNSTTQKIIVR